MKTEKTIRQWIFLPFKFAVKALLVIFMVCYTLIGENSVVALYKRNISRAQDISTFSDVLRTAKASEKFIPLNLWLRARPLQETDKLVEMITPESAILNPGIFFEMSRRELELGRTEEALFWLQLGRYRMKFDVMRCNAGPSGAKTFSKLLDLLPTPEEIDTLLAKHPELLKKAIQRVLDFDAKYPAHNSPNEICKINRTYVPVDEKSWERFRLLLRKHTEDFIKNPPKEKQP